LATALWRWSIASMAAVDILLREDLERRFHGALDRNDYLDCSFRAPPVGFNVGNMLAEVAHARLLQRRPVERDGRGGRDGQFIRAVWLGVEADTQPDPDPGPGPVRPGVSEVEELVPAGRDPTEKGAFAALAGLHEPLIGVRGIGIHALAGDLHVRRPWRQAASADWAISEAYKRPATRWLSVYFERHWCTTIFCKFLIYKNSGF
jgi:hypothetical protein